MNDDQRAQVLDNARYLRQVRPIDPDEIYEYVEGSPHPAVVRQVLREEAPTLELVEREDGRFEPVSDEPLMGGVDRVEEFPEQLARTLEEQLVERFGPGWPDGESGARLRATIRDFKQRYLHGATVTYDDVTALGYAIYHLPSYFAAVQYVLDGLVSAGLLPSHLRVLDVGAGVGGPALGLDALVGEETLVEYDGIEPSDAAPLLETFLEETGRNFHPTVHRTRIEEFDLEGEYDLILCANVLSELDEPGDVLETLAGALAEDGSLVAIAPADRNTATQLREIEREIEHRADLTVFSPTVRLWPHQTPESSSWSFDRKPALAEPAFQQRLDEGERTDSEQREDQERARDHPDRPGEDTSGPRKPGDGEFVNVDVQYAYSILRPDGTTAVEFRPNRKQVSTMAETEKHVTDRVDYVAIKLSPDLSDGGNPLFLVGDGSQKVDHFAVLTESSLLNQDLAEAAYGDVLHFENVLVLWNDDEAAYNLVVDGETVVERIPA